MTVALADVNLMLASKTSCSRSC